MRALRAGVLLLAAFPLKGAESPADPPSDGADDEATVAAWNGGRIGLRELRNRYRHHLAQRMRGQPRALDPEPERSVLLRLLEQEVAGRVLEEEAAGLGIEVPATAVDAFLAGQLGSEAWTRALMAEGLVYEDDYRRQARRMLTRQAVADRLLGEIPPSEEEFKAWRAARERVQSAAAAEQRCVHQVVVRTESEAKKALERLRKDGEIEAVARERSIAPEAGQGGFMGCFHRGELPEFLEDVVFGLKPRQPGDIIQSSFGFHVLYWYGPERDRPSEAAWTSSEEVLRRQWKIEEGERRVGEWLRQAMIRRDVKIHKELLP